MRVQRPAVALCMCDQQMEAARARVDALLSAPDPQAAVIRVVCSWGPDQHILVEVAG